jgi:hypothetical protein
VRPTIIRAVTRLAGRVLFVALGLAATEAAAQVGASQAAGIIEGRVLNGASGAVGSQSTAGDRP